MFNISIKTAVLNALEGCNTQRKNIVNAIALKKNFIQPSAMKPEQHPQGKN